jgi:predicted cupin superfamily sugar epimerase
VSPASATGDDGAGLDAEALIERLELHPHAEGGHYRRVWQHEEHGADGRPLASAITYLLPHGVTSRWHRVDAMELWEHELGSPLEVSILSDTGGVAHHVIGIESAGLRRVVVPAGAWQRARSMGEFSLVTCTVTPGFVWDGFELAEEGWEPGA